MEQEPTTDTTIEPTTSATAQTEAPIRTATVRADTPPPPAPPAQIPRADAAPSPDLVALLRRCAAVNWEAIDLDLPRGGYTCQVGAELDEAAATVKCECGRALIIGLDGASRARCQGCGAVFRHVLLIQREDMTPSTGALFVAELLRAAGVTP